MQMILDLRNKMELVVALCSKINYRLREESLKLGLQPRAKRAAGARGRALRARPRGLLIN